MTDVGKLLEANKENEDCDNLGCEKRENSILDFEQLLCFEFYFPHNNYDNVITNLRKEPHKIKMKSIHSQSIKNINMPKKTHKSQEKNKRNKWIIEYITSFWNKIKKIEVIKRNNKISK